MDTEIVKQALLRVDPHAADNWAVFEPILEEVHFNADTYLAHTGRISDTAYFVVSGIVRAFTTYQFGTAYTSFITQTPSVVSLQTLTPVSGFHLIEEHPEVVQLIPIKYVASYLGIEPESLSRIRKSLG